MQSAWASGALATPPSTPSSLSVGYPTDGLLGTNPPTAPGAWWFHMVTQELLAVVNAGGVTPSATTLNQLLTALQALFVQAGHEAVTGVFGRTGAVTAQSGDYTVSQITGAAPLASPALTGTPTIGGSAALALSNFTGSNQSFASSGYQKLPGGLILQWTTATISGASSTSISWPTTFPSACRGALVTSNGAFMSTTSPGATSVSTTGAVLDCSSTSDTPTVFVFALGN